MKKMILGNTGIEVNRLGFGGIPIQRVDESQAVETVVHAIEKGVDFIDTARMYTTSESRIGKALKLTDKKVAVATKSLDRTSDGIQKDIEASLKELRLGYIDLYQCHGVSNEVDYRDVISDNGAFSGLLKAKEEGLIGHIGITSHCLDLLELVIDEGLFDTIMVCFSFLEPAAREKIIPKAVEKKIGVIAMKPFSGGVIETPDIALKYVLANLDILVLAGVEQTALFDQNWEIFKGSYDLSDADKQEIEKIRKQYDSAFCRRCDYCQPCSEEIPIQLVLGIRWLVKRMGPQALDVPHFKEILEKAKNCSECEECMTRCPYNLPIPSMIQDNLKWVEGLKSNL